VGHQETEQFLPENNFHRRSTYKEGLLIDEVLAEATHFRDLVLHEQATSFEPESP
jgi:hypothetical protein